MLAPKANTAYWRSFAFWLHATDSDRSTSALVPITPLIWHSELSLAKSSIKSFVDKILYALTLIAKAQSNIVIKSDILVSKNNVAERGPVFSGLERKSAKIPTIVIIPIALVSISLNLIFSLSIFFNTISNKYSSKSFILRLI